MPRLLHYALAVGLAAGIFAYVSLGDFSWVLRTGALTLEPNLEALDGPGFIASPALQAIILRLLFLVLCLFFCCIPNLPQGLFWHLPGLLLRALLVGSAFSYFAGGIGWIYDAGAGGSAVRICSLIMYAGLVCCGFDTKAGRFVLPPWAASPAFPAVFCSFFLLICAVISCIFANLSWLQAETLPFFTLRFGVVASAFTGALAFRRLL